MKIREEIAKFMSLPESLSKGCLRASFMFPSNFVGFQGHFPEGKILPGVCYIQCVTVMIEKHVGRGVLLKEIISAKYPAPVLPSEEILFSCRGLDSTADEFVVRATASRGEVSVAELKMRVSLDPIRS